jgi:hypothetical protein
MPRTIASVAPQTYFLHQERLLPQVPSMNADQDCGDLVIWNLVTPKMEKSPLKSCTKPQSDVKYRGKCDFNRGMIEKWHILQDGKISR